MQYKLINAEQGTALIKTLWPKMKAALEVGKELCLTVEEAHRSDDQNKKYHAIIAEIAKQAQHMGARWGIPWFSPSPPSPTASPFPAPIRSPP